MCELVYTRVIHYNSQAYLLTSLGEHELGDGAVVGGEHLVEGAEQGLVRPRPLRLYVAYCQTW